MEYILHIVLALLSLGATDAGLVSGAPRPLLVLALVLVPHALGLGARSAQYHGRFRVSLLLERVLVLSPFALQVLAVTSLGWLESIKQWTGVQPSLSIWPGLELLWGIAPFLVFELAALHARTLLRNPRTSNRGALFGFQARMLLSGLAPFALYVLLSAALGKSEGLRVRLEEVSLYNTIFTVGLLGAFLGLLPFLLRSTWSTNRLPSGEVRGLLEDIAKRSGFEFRELLRWNTGGQMANAAIVGLTARSRVVLFTDALIEQLRPSELAAVFAHEIGHARRRHALTFVLFVLILFVGGQVLLEVAQIENEWLGLGIFGALLVLWILAFGFLSRRFELDADLSSLEVLGDPLPLISALIRVTGAQAHERNGWRHFSTARRVRFLLAVAKDPALGQRLRRNLSRWTRGASIVAAALVLLWCQQIFELRPGEELLVDLRLGHWQQAAARIDGGLDVEPELLNLVARSENLTRGTDFVELERAALTAAQSGDFNAALDLLELARLRGEEDADARLDLLKQLALPREERTLSPDEQERLRRALPADWAEALVDHSFLGFGPQGSGAILRR